MADRTGILPNSPLVFSLASLRYAPWPLISKKIDEIHEDLRHVLPLLQHIQIQTIGSNGQAQPENGSIWMLMSGDRSRSLQISQDQVVLTSRRYTRFTEFSSLFETVLKALFSRMRFMHVTNIGVRYVDTIKARPGELLDQYLHSALLPPKFDGLKRSGGSCGAVYNIDEKELRVRCVAQPGALSIPEEIVPLLAMMQIPGRPFVIQPLESEQAILDMDALEAHEDPLEIDDPQIILDKLSSLHSVANIFFRRPDVCTDFAFSVWKGEK